jgi:hypothetical protein
VEALAPGQARPSARARGALPGCGPSAPSATGRRRTAHEDATFYRMFEIAQAPIEAWKPWRRLRPATRGRGVPPGCDRSTPSATGRRRTAHDAQTFYRMFELAQAALDA